MPIGAIIGAGASIGGAILGSKSQKKAANAAAQAATDNTAQNNALAREIYGENKQTLSPFVNTGTQASGAINALLGLGGSQQQFPQQQSSTSSPYSTAGYGDPLNYGQGGAMGGPLQGRYMAPGNAMWGQGGMFGGEPISGLTYSDGNQYAPQPQNAAESATTQAAPQNQQQQYQNAFDNYRNSTGYQFRQNEAIRGQNALFASKGVGQSGAAFKRGQERLFDLAGGEFQGFLNNLYNQQGVGLSAAGAQAGVSTNFVNQTTANNNSGASALANAAIAKGNANGNMWQGIAGGLGSIFGSSFG